MRGSLLILALLAGRADAATTLSQLRYAPDITITLGPTTAGPVDVANDNLAGSITLALAGQPASVAAYHYTGTVHWLVFDITVLLPGGLTATPQDVIAFNGTTYSKILDGASAGIPAGAMIDALASRDGVEFLLSLDRTTALPGPLTLGPADVARYAGGSWSVYFDATSAGVPAGVNLDGLDVLANGHMLVSFDTAGSFGSLNYNASDILEHGGGWEMAYQASSHDSAWNSANLRDFWARSSTVGTPPVMGNVPNQVATVGMALTTINLAGYVTLTEGDPILSYAYTGTLPPGVNFSTSTGAISGTPTLAGIYTISVTASDKDGASNADGIQFTVGAAPPPGPGGAAPIPALSGWSMGLLSLLIGALASLFARERFDGNRKGSSS